MKASLLTLFLITQLCIVCLGQENNTVTETGFAQLKAKYARDSVILHERIVRAVLRQSPNDFSIIAFPALQNFAFNNMARKKMVEISQRSYNEWKANRSQLLYLDTSQGRSEQLKYTPNMPGVSLPGVKLKF